MLNAKIQDALNKQLGAELFSAYLYLSMSAHFEARSLKGMAHWMRVQAQEEVGHVLRHFDFINERDGRVMLAAVDAPKTEWDSPLDAFEDAYEHECMISARINELADLALREGDHAAGIFLQWFVTEQVEEEASVKTVVDRLKMVGENGVALFMLDGQLGQRMATTPAAEA